MLLRMWTSLDIKLSRDRLPWSLSITVREKHWSYRLLKEHVWLFLLSRDQCSPAKQEGTMGICIMQRCHSKSPEDVPWIQRPWHLDWEQIRYSLYTCELKEIIWPWQTTVSLLNKPLKGSLKTQCRITQRCLYSRGDSLYYGTGPNICIGRR